MGVQMGQTPASDHDWTIHSLNVHGTFFQNKIAYIVYNHNPNRLHFLTTEYPVEFPPNNRRDESRLDVLGFIPAQFSKNSGVYLIIECKKCNPDFVDWVFYPTIQNQLIGYDDSRITVLRNCNVYINKQTGDISRAELGLTNRMSFDLQISGDCREARGSYDGVAKDKKTKTSNASITDASYQVTLATHSIAMEQYKQNAESIKETGQQLFNNNIYVPIIVTTANLFMINYDLKDIDLSTGEIPLDKAILKPLERLFYEYPIPPHLQTNLDDKYLQPYDFIKKDFRVRRYILVVNAKHFEDALNWLISHEDAFLDSY
jgi:hypothetical protein